jgi:hypothetical protein
MPSMGIKIMDTIIVNPNKTALLILPTALSDNFQKSLQSHNRKNPGHQAAPKKPTFSVGIRNIPLDITPDISIVNAWKIISRKTYRPTTFIKVLTLTPTGTTYTTCRKRYRNAYVTTVIQVISNFWLSE